MTEATQASKALLKLRCNLFPNNVLTSLNQHQKHDKLVDVTLSCEKKMIAAHKLILSASSLYFRKLFENYTTPHSCIILFGVKFKHLQKIIEFVYTGEVHIEKDEVGAFLALGESLNVVGLCEPIDKGPESNTNAIGRTIAENDDKVVSQEKGGPKVPKKAKKRKISLSSTDSTATLIKDIKQERHSPPPPPQNVNISLKDKPAIVPELPVAPVQFHCAERPTSPILDKPKTPDAFMIFTTEWRDKLQKQFPMDDHTATSVKLGNMWAKLSDAAKSSYRDQAEVLQKNATRDGID